jgi:hypothetical protein
MDRSYYIRIYVPRERAYVEYIKDANLSHELPEKGGL